MQTNLLPKEIIQDRLIKRKKPWAVAAAAALMIGCTVSFAAYALALGAVDPAKWDQAEKQAAQVSKEASGFKAENDVARAKFKTTDEIGQHLIANVEGRVRWLELLKAINVCLPPYPPAQPEDWSVPIDQRSDLHITSVDGVRVDDVAGWFAIVKSEYKPATEIVDKSAPADPPAPGPVPSGPAPMPGKAPPGPPGGASAAPGGRPASPVAAVPAPGAPGDPGGVAGPKGPGWIIQLDGHHYHNKEQQNQGRYYVRETLIKKLLTGKVTLPNDSGGTEEVTLRELGISYPVITSATRLEDEDLIDPSSAMGEPGIGGPQEEGPTGRGGMGRGGMGRGGMGRGGMGRGGIGPSARGGMGRGPAPTEAAASNAIHVKRVDFVVQFCWQPTTATQRALAKKGAGQSNTPTP